MPTQNRHRPKRPSVEGEEEKTWCTFYKRSPQDPALAAEVLKLLDSDPEMKRSRMALYLCCKESVRKDKAKQARNQRIGAFVRRLAAWLFVFPLEVLRRTGRESRDIIIDMLPEAEPPLRRPAAGYGALAAVPVAAANDAPAPSGGLLVPSAPAVFRHRQDKAPRQTPNAVQKEPSSGSDANGSNP